MKLRNILLLLTVFFAFNACSDDTEPRLEKPDKPVLEKHEDRIINITEDNLGETALELKWTANKSEIGVVTEYGIQIDKSGNDFEGAKILAEVAELTYSVDGATLNDFLVKSFSQSPGDAVRYDVRIVPIVKGKDKVGVVFSESASERQMLIVTTVESQSTPENIYMIGAQFGDWDWSSDGIVEMIPVHSQEGEFWTVKYIEAGKGFKWAPSKEWKNDFDQLEVSNGFTNNDGNAFVDNDGLYMIYINYLKGEITIEAAAISGMGDCFGGWTEGDFLFDIEGQVATITTVGAGELRMTAGSSATNTDWWTREFILRDGVIEYRGTGDDQEPRVTVEANKKITLDFNANKGTIK